MAALLEAKGLQDLFRQFAPRATERRLAYSLDRQRIDEVMYFLDVYSFVRGSDVLPSALVRPHD